jgi:hypothetical protein
MNRERFVLAVRYRALEQFETQRRERIARICWLERATELWDSDRYPSWELFAQTEWGRPLQRRLLWVLRKAV